MCQRLPWGLRKTVIKRATQAVELLKNAVQAAPVSSVQELLFFAVEQARLDLRE